MKSYRKQRIKELNEGMRHRHELAGRTVVRFVKMRTPVGRPETTGKPNYPVTHRLQNSIDHKAYNDHVDIGTRVPYAKYVHNGTGPHFRGRDEWSEREAEEFNAIYLIQYGDVPGKDRKPGFAGMKPRAYLVNGLLKARAPLRVIYSQPIKGGPPHG